MVYVVLTLLTLACSMLPANPSVDLQGTKPFVCGKEGYAVYRTPALVVSKRNTILAFCGGRVNDHKDEGDIDIVLKRSADGGKTWGKLQILADDGPNPCKGACPVVLPNGHILVVYLWNKSVPTEKERTTREVYVITSDDEGANWSKPRNITQDVYRTNWGWYGIGPCHAIIKRQMPNKGRIIVMARHEQIGKKMASHVIYSDDNGKSWSIGGIVDRRSSECTIVELSNGDLMMNSRNQNDNEDSRVVAISKDGGITFGKPYLDTALIEPRGCQGSLLYHSLNETTGKGNILFSNPHSSTVRSNGSIKLSQNDGQTWTAMYTYAPKAAPYFTGYSDIARLSNGDIGLLYERGDISNTTKKGDRYDEVAFVIIPFKVITAPLPASKK